MQTSSESVESRDSSTSQGPSSFPSPLNGVVIFVITTLGVFFQVQYQSKNTTPFEEHYNTMWAVSVALSLYAMMLIGEFKLEVHKCSFISIIKRFTVLIGALVAVLLTIIVLPWFGYLKLILWIICFVKAILASYEEICQCFCQGIRRSIEMMSSYFGRENGRLLPI